MSKSLGNVINPFDIVEKYGTDTLRYVLLRHTSAFEDSDITLEAIKEHYTAHLTNGLGNLVARVMKLAEDNQVVVPAEVRSNRQTSLESNVVKALNSFAFNEAMDFIWSEIQRLDRKITEEEPYKLVKTNPFEGKIAIQFLVSDIREIAKTLKPFMPQTSEKILDAIKENKKPENLFPRL